MDERNEFSEFLRKLIERDLEGFPIDDSEDEEEGSDIIYKPKKRFVTSFVKDNKTFAS